MGPGSWGRRGVMRTAAAATAQLVLAAGVSAAQQPPRVTTLTGIVVDSVGAPLALASVSVLPERGLRAVTDDSGRFAIDSVPVGRERLFVRRLGYAPGTFIVVLREGAPHPLRLTLGASAFVLEPVTVADSAPDAWMRVFEERRLTGRGYFFTRPDIEKAQSTSDLLRRVPGVRIANGRWGPVVLFQRGGRGGAACTPQVFVHMIAYSGSVTDFSPDDIEAMEVYTGISEVPVQLQSAVAHSCGAIVLWMRDPNGNQQ